MNCATEKTERAPLRYYAGPMEGITNRLYRQTHRRYFPGADKYFAPFLSPTRDFRFTPHVLEELLPELEEAAPLVPQLLVNSAEPFLDAARELEALGFREANLNLGCPSRTVTAKRKGAGLLADPAALDRLLARVFSGIGGIRVSVKTRMGIAAPEEFAALLAVFDRYPIAELTVHARVQEDFYRRPAAPEALARYAADVAAPFCYNGDLLTQEDAARILPLFPRAEAAMLGRGLIADPALILRLRGQRAPEKSVYRAFHDELAEGYRAMGWDARAVLCHMKEIWTYMAGLFAGSEREAKRIRKANTLEAYADAVDAIFALPLRSETENGKETH